MTYVSVVLRRLIIQRAGQRCEYCLFPQSAALFTFEIEHVIAQKHGGETEAENLALACPYCNRAKGTDLGSIDPLNQKLTPFFNPRRQKWQDHFRLEDAFIIALTPEGRVTIKIFQFNELDRLQERERLIATGIYPDIF